MIPVTIMAVFLARSSTKNDETSTSTPETLVPLPPTSQLTNSPTSAIPDNIFDQGQVPVTVQVQFMVVADSDASSNPGELPNLGLNDTWSAFVDEVVANITEPTANSTSSTTTRSMLGMVPDIRCRPKSVERRYVH